MSKKIQTPKNNDASFDRVAWVYDWLASRVFGFSIRDAQISVLEHIEPNSDILLIGGGTGWILPHFPDRNLTIYYLEASPAMIKKSQARNLPQKSNQVIFQLGNESFLKNKPPFDIIFTPFFLDLFEKKLLSRKRPSSRRSRTR